MALAACLLPRFIAPPDRLAPASPIDETSRVPAPRACTGQRQMSAFRRPVRHLGRGSASIHLARTVAVPALSWANADD